MSGAERLDQRRGWNPDATFVVTAVAALPAIRWGGIPLAKKEIDFFYFPAIDAKK